jgi:hypothetical protein
MRGEKAEMLKKVPGMIQDEFISKHYIGWNNLEMHWFGSDILVAQGHLTEFVEHSGTETSRELRVVSWVEFWKKSVRASL